MIGRTILLVASAAACAASPVWAAPPADPGAQGRGHAEHQARGHARGRARRCAPHAVAYVAAGTLRSQALVLDAGGRAGRPTYSGDVTLAVRTTNRHARADAGTTKTYTLDHVRLVLGLDDQNGDGSVDLADVLPGSRAKVVGTVTKLAKHCDAGAFTPTLSIAKLIVHAPEQAS